MSRLLSLLALVLVACGEPIEGDDNEQVVQKKKKKNDSAAVELDSSYFYNPAGKRDPFQDFVQRRGDEGAADTPPLQRWDIDKFTLRGVIWSTTSPRALLVDPEGTGHPVALGTQVGRNFGKVTDISDKSVVVTEEYQTPDGQLVVNPVEVRFTQEGNKR
ncbi:MAG: hypothetical protein RLZZ299_1211 [Pseudomonadota bacterium]|jgi:Tfp pilus assembly protein PilP